MRPFAHVVRWGLLANALLIASVRTAQIYWGAVPLVLIQLLMVVVLIVHPK